MVLSASNMSLPTLFVTRLDGHSTRVTLGRDQTHQLGQVLRAKVGDTVRLLDGQGTEAVARLEGLGRSAAALTVESWEREQAPPLPHITLAQAWPKGEKAKTVVTQATELGARAILFFTATRSVSRPRPLELDAKWSRLQSQAIDALRLSRRRWLPELRALPSLNEVLEQSADADLKLMLWEEERHQGLRALLAAQPAPSKVVVLVGPEGGFAAGEVEAARAAGFHTVSLGPTVLAAGTVPPVILGILGFWFTEVP